MVPSMYDLMWVAELVTAPSSKTEKPHLDATVRRKTNVSTCCFYEGIKSLIEDLIANIVLPDEVSQKLFVDAGLVDDLQSLVSIHRSQPDQMAIDVQQYPRRYSQAQEPSEALALLAQESSCFQGQS